jgi:hypothetical protein
MAFGLNISTLVPAWLNDFKGGTLQLLKQINSSTKNILINPQN